MKKLSILLLFFVAVNLGLSHHIVRGTATRVSIKNQNNQTTIVITCLYSNSTCFMIDDQSNLEIYLGGSTQRYSGAGTPYQEDEEGDWFVPIND